MRIMDFIKKITGVFMVCSLLLNTNVALSYTNTNDFAISSLLNLGIINGDLNGDLDLTSNITRAELAQLYLNYYQFKYNNYPEFGLFKNQYKYEDVNEDDWFYKGVILTRLLDANHFCDIEEGRLMPLREEFYFRPYDTVNVYDFRNALMYQTKECYFYRKPLYPSVKAVTKHHYPNCDARPLTRQEAFLLFFDFMNEPINVIEYDSLPSNHYITYNKITDDGDATDYHTPLTERGYYIIYGRVINIYEGFADIEIIYSNNFENVAYGEEYDTIKIINKVSIENTKVEKDGCYSFLINCENEQYECIGCTPEKRDFVYNNGIFN